MKDAIFAINYLQFNRECWWLCDDGESSGGRVLTQPVGGNDLIGAGILHHGVLDGQGVNLPNTILVHHLLEPVIESQSIFFNLSFENFVGLTLAF